MKKIMSMSEMVEPGEQKTILVLGGYGAVGSAVCEELARTFAGHVIVAGRNLKQARRLAQQLGGRVETVQVDAAQPAAYRDLFEQLLSLTPLLSDTDGRLHLVER